MGSTIATANPTMIAIRSAGDPSSPDVPLALALRRRSARVPPLPTGPRYCLTHTPHRDLRLCSHESALRSVNPWRPATRMEETPWKPQLNIVWLTKTERSA